MLHADRAVLCTSAAGNGVDQIDLGVAVWDLAQPVTKQHLIAPPGLDDSQVRRRRVGKRAGFDLG